MKITPEHFSAIKCGIDEYLENKVTLDIVENYRKAGLSNKRLRWDIFIHCKINGTNSLPFICDTLYKYLNDEHIDTALRNVFGHAE